MSSSIHRNRTNDRLIALLFLSPSIIIFGLFVYYPLVYNGYLSLTSWNFIAPVKSFAGIGNYGRLLAGSRFWDFLFNTAYYAVGHVALSMILGLALALLLKGKIRGRGLFRTLFYFPNVTTTSAVALLWVWIYDPRFGPVNYGLGLIGIRGPHWLLDPVWSMPAVIFFSTWRSVGYVMLIYLGGLLSIPDDFYEAAAIDGANGWQTFRNITLPLLSPTTFFILVTSLIVSLQVFDAIAVMTDGGPAGATTVLNFYIWQKAFIEFKAGTASAVAVILFLMILALTIMQNALSKRWVHYTAE